MMTRFLFLLIMGLLMESHFHNLEKALNNPLMDMNLAKRIVKTAKTTARLYQMQLDGLGNY